MSTKVKGEAIKDGSIPLSALSQEVKNKIENAGGGADWNAQEGEAGYIENKPCYVNLNNGMRLTLDNADITLSTDQKWYEKIIFQLNEPFVISLYFYDFHEELRHYVLTEGQSVDDSHFGCTFTAVLNEYGLCNLVLTNFTDNKEYIDNAFAETKIVYELGEIIRKLDSIYLPDTVLKTTPQSFSDTEKNQVKENLGIETPDWNAQEGESGYIENKPLSISNDDIESYITPEFNELYEPTEDGYYYVSTHSIEDLTDEDSLIIKTFYSSMSEEYKDIHHFTFKDHVGIYEYTFDAVKVVLNFDEYIIEFKTNESSTDREEFLYKFAFSNEVYKIESCYIPNTVLKTTPQTLSTADKNQALANLGIDMFTNYKNLGGDIFDIPELYYKYKSVDRRIAKSFSYEFGYSGEIDENLRVILIYGVIEDVIKYIRLNEGVGHYGGDFESFNIDYYMNDIRTGEFIIISDLYEDNYRYNLSININSGVYKLTHVEEV